MGYCGLVQIKDLPLDAVLAATVSRVQEGHESELIGGTCMRLFSKKGRLKTVGAPGS